MKCLLLKVASYLCFSFLFLCMGLFISSGYNIKDLNGEITNKIHVEIQGFAFRICGFSIAYGCSRYKAIGCFIFVPNNLYQQNFARTNVASLLVLFNLISDISAGYTQETKTKK